MLQQVACRVGQNAEPLVWGLVFGLFACGSCGLFVVLVAKCVVHVKCDVQHACFLLNMLLVDIDSVSVILALWTSVPFVPKLSECCRRFEPMACPMPSCETIEKRERLVQIYKANTMYNEYQVLKLPEDPDTPKTNTSKRTWEKHLYMWKNAMRYRMIFNMHAAKWWGMFCI